MEEAKVILRLGLILLFGVVILVFVGSMLRLPEEGGDQANIDADNRCLAACAAAGSPSLNAFYDPRHAQCFCQAPEATDDAHGYYLLGPLHD